MSDDIFKLLKQAGDRLGLAPEAQDLIKRVEDITNPGDDGSEEDPYEAAQRKIPDISSDVQRISDVQTGRVVYRICEVCHDPNCECGGWVVK